MGAGAAECRRNKGSGAEAHRCPAAPRANKVGLSSPPPSSSGQSGAANAVARRLARSAEDAEHFLGAIGLFADASLSQTLGGKNHSYNRRWEQRGSEKTEADPGLQQKEG